MILVYSFSYSINSYAKFLDQTYEINSLDGQGLSKSEYKDVLAKIRNTYRSEILKKGGVLKLTGYWKSTTLNAFAMRFGPLWTVTIHGGIPKHPQMTKDILALIVCHEVGHHLGGAPKSTVMFKRWNSYEGQADYWATAKCLPKLWHKDNNQELMAKTKLPEVILDECRDDYLCQRVMHTALKTSEFIAGLKDLPAPKIETPDTNIVETTDPWHPKAQCRLDTYVQGVRCDQHFSAPVSDEDPAAGFCTREQGSDYGTRPQCWYRP